LTPPPELLHRALEERIGELEFAYQLSTALSRAATIDEVYDEALDGVLHAVGADRASLLLFDAGGVMRFVAWRGLSEAYRRAVDGHSPWRPTDPDPRPILVPDVLEDASLAEFRGIIAGEGIRALAFIPLIDRGRLIGKFMAYWNQPWRLADGQLRQVETVANHVAFSIERQRAEDGLREARDAAERASRMKSDFAASLSHELRTPLNSIIGYIELLRLGIPQEVPARVGDYVDKIGLSASHLVQLIDEVLTFSRVESGQEEVHPEDVDVPALVDEVRTMMQPMAAAAHLDFQVVVAADDRAFRTDAAKLRQILINLLGNAVKFTERGTIRLSIRQDRGILHATVADTGIGMSQDELERAFTPFWRAGGTASGTGLGLTITARLTELLGGTLDVNSAPRVGTTFTIALPALEAAAQPAVRQGTSA